MNRREFLGLGALAAASVASGESAKVQSPKSEVQCPGIPAWAKAQIEAATARFRAWKGADETVSFTFMTDVHSFLTEKKTPPDFGNSRYHPLVAQACADFAGCDFLVDGGDHDYDNGRPSPEDALKRMAVAESVYHDYAAKPVLFCLGNHDHGSFPADKTKQRPISSALFGDTFNALAEKHGFKVVFGENRSWGYYDVPDKKFRAVFCNTSDEGYYGFSKSQLDFVVQALATMPEGWTAAAFGHYCVFSEIGHWKRWQSDGESCVRRKDFMAAMQAFAKKRPRAFAGYFCGDSHFDNEMELRGVNYTISQGYGGVGKDDLPWGARYTPFSRGKSVLFELVGVKPAKGEFKIFRVGAGGEACDRACSYWMMPR